MICILKIRPTLPWEPSLSIDGWIIATDIHDAWRQAMSTGERALAAQLYRAETLNLARGQHVIPVSPDQSYLMLVS